MPFLDDADAAVREAALGAVAPLLRPPGLAPLRPAAAASLERMARAGGARRERAAALLALAALGGDAGALLADPDPAVRACAALGTRDPQALPVLLAVLADPVAVDAWFEEPLPLTEGRFRFTLLAGLLDRAGRFEDVLPVALAMAPLCAASTVDHDWGPLLACAFPGGRRPGLPLTRAQHAFLSVLVERNPCWGVITDRDLWLRAAGLPADRDALRALLAESAAP
ncbi:hypothetical protein ACFYXS_12840 [Streptomyces sp. NPDC002574]|uniref:hypothetical protein n=1 Tax=Streptomyces sp. NPDC002574 TaxID=3364652 RepID=UPI00368EA28A